MTSPQSDIRDEDLNAYLDGELEEDARRSVESALARSADLRERLAAYRRDKASLAAAFDPVLDEPVPDRLRLAARGDRRATAPGLRPLTRIAAALALLAVGGVAGWTLNESNGRAGPEALRLADEAVTAHAVFVSEVRHPVEVAASEQAHLFAWLSNRLGGKVWAPDLAALGYDLVGGRLLASSRGPAAQFMYENESGKRLTLFVRRGGEESETAFRHVQADGTGAFYWIEGDFGYALIGGLARDPLLRAARAVYSELRAPPAVD